MDSTTLNGVLAGSFLLLFMILLFAPVIIRELLERSEKRDKAKFIVDVLRTNSNLTADDINKMWNGFKSER